MKKSSSTFTRQKLLIGAHESIAGGIHRAFDRAASVGCRTMQIFTKNSNRWTGKPCTDQDIANYKTAASKSTIFPVIAHDAYLINLCAAATSLRQKSIDALVDELHRCNVLGVRYLVFHPGAHTGQGEKEGLRLIIESLNEVHARTPGYNVMSVVETTAGQGTTLGYRFEHLREIIGGVEERERMAVCIDTCHIFAAGYDLRTEQAYNKTMEEFDAVIGLQNLAVIHVNDSKKMIGARVDRHEHIGRGAIGREGFRLLMQDARLFHIPKILETPKGEDLEEDKINLMVLESLARSGRRKKIRSRFRKS